MINNINDKRRRRQSIKEVFFANNTKVVSPLKATSSSSDDSIEIDDIREVTQLTPRRSTQRRAAVKPAPIRKKTLYYCNTCIASIYENDDCFMCSNCTSVCCSKCNQDNKCGLCLKKLVFLDKNKHIDELIPIKKSRCFCLF